MLPFHCCVTMEMSKTHCFATVTVTLLWKCHKPTVMQQQLSRYYGNATGCIGHVTKENPICNNILEGQRNWLLMRITERIAIHLSLWCALLLYTEQLSTSTLGESCPATAMQVPRGRGGIPILELGTRWGEWSALRSGRALPSGKGPPVPVG
jgi:hypothetical protein